MANTSSKDRDGKTVSAGDAVLVNDQYACKVIEIPDDGTGKMLVTGSGLGEYVMPHQVKLEGRPETYEQPQTNEQSGEGVAANIVAVDEELSIDNEDPDEDDDEDLGPQL